MTWTATQMLGARRVEKRAIMEVPWDVGAPDRASVTQSRALGLAYVYAANRHLGDLISTLPVAGFRDLGSRRERMDSLPPLFRFLTLSGELVSWVFEAVVSLGLRGNAAGLITNRDGMGFATGVVWRPMEEWFVDDTSNPARPQWYYKGRRIDRSELVHIPWFKLPGKTLGLSPIEAYALTISQGLQAQEYGDAWFANGGIPPGKFKNAEKKVPQEEADVIKARLVAAIRRRQPLVYGADWDYEPIMLPPEQSQFIQTLKLTANQVAAIYGVEPEEIGGEPADGMEYKNEEHRQTTRLANAQPWLVRLESAFASWLPERQYVRFNADAVVRADLKTRHEVYEIDRRIGIRSVNEIRALDELPPVPGGDAMVPSPPPTVQQPATDAVRSNGHPPEWALIP